MKYETQNTWNYIVITLSDMYLHPYLKANDLNNDRLLGGLGLIFDCITSFLEERVLTKDKSYIHLWGT